MEISYLSHSCFKIVTNDLHIIFDPFISPNESATSIKVDDLKADYIFLSHAHADHIADVEKIYASNQATLVSNWEIITWYQNKKNYDRVHPMNHGGKWKFDFGTVKMVNAVHSSSFPDGTYGGNPAGFVFESEGITFYYAGDTALSYDMQLIKEDYSIDFAFMPIGDNFTMDIGDALKAAEFVGTSKIIAMHFDTFPYIKIDHEKAKKLAFESKKELLLLNIGEKINL